MPLSGLYNERVHVGGREGLWREKQEIAGAVAREVA